MKTREVVEQIRATPASDGAGVKLLRVFGGARTERFDPFLMLDEFGSDSADDYIAGFPAHPHRGFETVTYMLEGKMAHRDHMGNEGLLDDGDVQWMTAGRGIIHEEMPRQTEGRMRGFQLWLNLPAKDKMQPANYKDVPEQDIPDYTIGDITVRAIAGEAMLNDQLIKGYFDVRATHALYLDVHLPVGRSAELNIDADFNAMIYTYNGTIAIGPRSTPAHPQTLSRLGKGDAIQLRNNSEQEARVLVLAGKALKEPIAQYGPFVMNTQQQVEQAIQDYRMGRLTEAPS